MNTLVRKYLNYLSAMNKSKCTLIAYESDLKAWTMYQFGNRDASGKDFAGLDLNDVYDYIGHIQDRADSTKARTVACIKSFYKYMKESKMIIDNPMIELKQPKVERKLPKYLTQAESTNLLNCTAKINSRYPERDYAVLTLFLNCGMRLSELIGLNMEDVHNDAILIRGKGAKQRQLPLNQMCRDALDRYLRTRVHNDGDAIFISERNHRVSAKTVHVIVKKYLQEIDKDNLSPHSLRHTFATLMLSNNVNLRVIQDFLGHESLATTEKYMHINNDDMRKAADWNPLNKLYNDAANQ